MRFETSMHFAYSLSTIPACSSSLLFNCTTFDMTRLLRWWTVSAQLPDEAHSRRAACRPNVHCETVCFSIAAATLASPLVIMAISEEPNVSRNGSILIVEDDVHVREMIAEYLSGHGYEVCQAQSGGDMREAVERCLPDVVLLDVRLPGEDGLSLARYL